MKKQNGISLIVLVITIIVIIILAGAVILSLANNNPIAQATEATYKANLESYNSELNMTLSSKYVQDTSFNPNQFYANSWDGVSDPTGTVKEYVPSISAQDAPNYIISQGKLQYIGSDVTKKQWAKSVGTSDGLIAYFKMNGDASESIQNFYSSINGTLIGANDRFGRANGALEFGSAGYSFILANLSQLNERATFCAWVYPKQYPTERSTIVLGVTPGSQNSFYMSLYTNGSLQSWWYEKVPAGYHTTPASVIPLNQWSFVCTSWDGINNKLYVNGVLLNTIPVTGMGRIQTNMRIGAESVDRQFYGNIDDVRVYNRALSQTEITNLYNSSAAEN